MFEIPAYYEYCCRVKILAGHDALEKIPDLLDGLGASRPLIVSDKGVSGAGLVDALADAMGDKAKIGGVEDDVPPDSSFQTVKRIADAYRRLDCDALLAVGGGSVLDTAKGVNILVSENADDLMRFSGAGVLKKRLQPLIAVPTTAGTGSETTLVAVIKDLQRHIKMFFLSHFLQPDAAVLDSRMTLSLPPTITAATAMDALTHAVEAYTCLAKNPLSDTAAQAAIKLIGRHLPLVMQQPDSRDDRLAMALAATLAGMAFSNSMTGMVHGLGHALGAVCGLPHGVAMAIMLPYGLEYNLHRNGHFTAELLLPLVGSEKFAQTPREERAEAVIKSIRALNQQLHEATGGRHPRCLKEARDQAGALIVPSERLSEVARTALNDGALVFNPEGLDGDDCLMVLQNAWHGTPLDRTRVRRG